MFGEMWKDFILDPIRSDPFHSVLFYSVQANFYNTFE